MDKDSSTDDVSSVEDADLPTPAVLMEEESGGDEETGDAPSVDQTTNDDTGTAFFPAVNNKKEISRLLSSFQESFARTDNATCSTTSSKDWIARWRPWQSWSHFRSRSTAIGCLSSTVVLVVRLYLDHQPLAYLIHSIVVFLDMVLIHSFTNSVWLSVSGELVTFICFLAFHFTKESVFELLETTVIAVLCSFHLIAARNKHKDQHKKLQEDVKQFRHNSMMLIRSMSSCRELMLQVDPILEFNDGNNDKDSKVGWMVHSYLQSATKDRVRGCGENFFEHFLDGSAGVMYTSFLGLIITELVTYGDSKKC